ncbi:MAG: low molecular weight phosphatase family protein [Nesterenkonia sp.]|uniref:arsenate reductase/protein-tyrosine-phosphatase family protein n=1 Tax=Nesterenkonia marinintestina TaxID=2979865 RepID=UPI0021C07A88|nr:low molecular weight phosphatase family protein [Nesterenkonia sp. GX14115]MDO5493980.1 low molecular weight phosphatase family protein [Nesterenkonia sp.]
MRTPAEPFRTVAVCTGNVCRSAQCAQILSARLRDHAPAAAGLVEVTSAGLHPRPGAPMPSEAAELSVRYGGEPSGHRARPVDPEEILAADLVLCMTRRHRQALVRTAPRASRRTFLLSEFAHLVHDLAVSPPDSPALGEHASTPDRLRALVRAAAQRRGLTTVPATLPEEVVDPFGGAAGDYRTSAEQIVACLDLLQDSLGDIVASADGGPRS